MAADRPSSDAAPRRSSNPAVRAEPAGVGSAGARDPLSREVKLLGALLGQVIVEQGGPELLDLVERSRQRAIAWREGGDASAAEAMARELDALDVDRAEALARAFSLYFQLINLAEEREAVRRLRQAERDASQPIEGSMGAAVDWLVERGWSDEAIRSLAGRLRVTPVLTAHPTEARRRTLLVALRRCYRLLEGLDDPRLTPGEDDEIRRRLREEISLLWRASYVRRLAPMPLDEVRTALAFFDETFFRVVPRVCRQLDRALDRASAASAGGEATAHDEVPATDTAPAIEDAASDSGRTGTRPPAVASFLRYGSWIGGDRDGNPNVTAELTRQVPRVHADHVLRGYEAVATRLTATLAIYAPHEALQPALEARMSRDAEQLPELMRDLARRFPDEPYRRRMGAIAERLRRTRAYLTEEAGPVTGRYDAAADLVAELDELQRCLVAERLPRVAFGEIQDFRWQVETFGFHLASLELRQHSEVHEAALGELRRPSPDLGRELVPGVTPAEVLATFRAAAAIQRRFGEEACRRFVVSFARGPKDVLNVLELARLAGEPGIPAVATSGLAPGVPALDVVPLFESADALEGCVEVVEALLSDPAYARHLAERGSRQEVMLGYSDSNKESGFLAAVWMLYGAQARLAEVSRRYGIELTLFHGRGGAIGRGGGPTNRAILSQAPRSIDARFKMTEQGETIAANYANMAIAERHLELVTSAVLVASSSDHDECVDEVDERGRAAMEELSSAARTAYRALVYDESEFESFFRSITPIAELSTMQLGSRPARRGSSEGAASQTTGIDKLRAIPWVFSWSQSRIGLPAWYGLGSAISAYEQRHGEAGIAHLAELYRDWPFFTSALDNAELILYRSEPQIATLYAALAGSGDGERLWSRILDEWGRSIHLLARVTGRREMLEGEPAVRRSIRLRRPYIDPLSHLQVRALARLRPLPAEDPERERLRRLVQLTVNGVAAGLQNTG